MKTKPQNAGSSLVREALNNFKKFGLLPKIPLKVLISITLSGTVQGSGFDCSHDEVNTFEE